MKLRHSVAAALTILGLSPLAAVAQPAAPPAKQCFFNNQLENWRAADARTIWRLAIISE